MPVFHAELLRVEWLRVLPVIVRVVHDSDFVVVPAMLDDTFPEIVNCPLDAAAKCSTEFGVADLMPDQRRPHTRR